MQSKEDVRAWAADPTADPTANAFRIERPNHCFGNSRLEKHAGADG